MRIQQKILASVAATAAAVMILAGCTAGGGDETPTESPASLAQYYEQDLAFEPCEQPQSAHNNEPPWPDAQYECARLAVPLDYANPGDASTDSSNTDAEIAVIRLLSRGGDAQGSVVLNPGGPGFSGVSITTDFARGWVTSPITESFDLVGFDPRGVGTSTPALDCFTDEERENDVKSVSWDSNPTQWTEETTQELADKCAERSGGMDVLSHMGTRDVARDLDVLREALGDDKLTFAGVSYGTRLGAVYAEMFPENVRALVLDGAMDPLMNSYDRRVDQYTNLQAAFEKVATVCATDASCPLGTDPAQASTVFQDLAQPLTENPLITADGREITHMKALGGVIAGLYAEVLWPGIIQGIAELKAGDGTTLLAMYDSYAERSPEGVYSNSLEANMAINCLDEDRKSPEEERKLAIKANEVAPFIDPGHPLDDVRDGCENWPVQPTLNPPYATDIEGLPDTLTVSVTGDAITPHAGGIILAETLGGSLLTVDGEQHGSILQSNECVNEVVADYLVDLKSPPADARCTL